MKIAFVGKGGSGKTTLAALHARHLTAEGHPVLAIDADINQHLAVALGGPAAVSAARPLSEHLPAIKEYLRGDNPRIASAAQMVKTTPPGRGSRLLRVAEENPIYAECVTTVGASGWPRPASSAPRTWGWPATTPRSARWSCC